MLQRITDDLWVADQLLRFFGLEIGARMTLFRLPDSNDLWIHSPIEPKFELINQIQSLGTVKYIVAPNKFHHLYLNDFKKVFPTATTYGAPGLKEKKNHLVIDEVLEQGATYPWSEVIRHHVVEGSPLFNEVVFYFTDLKTLLVTDLGLHICEDSPWLTRSVFRLAGLFKKYGWTGLEKRLFIRNKEAFRLSAQHVAGWDFDRILLSHGSQVESNGHQHFKTAFLEN